MSSQPTPLNPIFEEETTFEVPTIHENDPLSVLLLGPQAIHDVSLAQADAESRSVFQGIPYSPLND